MGQFNALTSVFLLIECATKLLPEFWFSKAANKVIFVVLTSSDYLLDTSPLHLTQNLHEHPQAFLKVSLNKLFGPYRKKDGKDGFSAYLASSQDVFKGNTPQIVFPSAKIWAELNVVWNPEIPNLVCFWCDLIKYLHLYVPNTSFKMYAEETGKNSFSWKSEKCNLVYWI